ncbi:MAG: AMP-binding protein, partial [Parvularculaceae bacterium]|nr:AMP-binding protein [Parvularculaceae bacterium]
TLIYSLRVGGHTVMAPDPRPVEKLRKAFETFKPDWVPGVNTLLAHLLEEDWMKSSSNRVATTITGGTALTRRVAENWQATTGASIVEAYGLTEATAAVTITIPGMAERDGSVGIPLPLTEVAILRDDNTFADTGEAGEIIVRGPQTMAGYLGSQELTDNAMYNDWLHTGDMGYQDEDGFVFLVDRKKDMINVSGFNVFPAEIEDCLADHPGVLEACVVGVPDDQTGEGVVAHIVRRRQNLTKEAVLEHCKERLTNYKRPRHIEFVDSLPKTPVGKILRREVRKQATQSHSTA